jgi:hypothetical protein
MLKYIQKQVHKKYLLYEYSFVTGSVMYHVMVRSIHFSLILPMILIKG